MEHFQFLSVPLLPPGPSHNHFLSGLFQWPPNWSPCLEIDPCPSKSICTHSDENNLSNTYVSSCHSKAQNPPATSHLTNSTSKALPNPDDLSDFVSFHSPPWPRPLSATLIFLPFFDYRMGQDDSLPGLLPMVLLLSATPLSQVSMTHSLDIYLWQLCPNVTWFRGPVSLFLLIVCHREHPTQLWQLLYFPA